MRWEILLIYMYKKDLALSNLQWLRCHKPKETELVGGIEPETSRWFYSEIFADQYFTHCTTVLKAN